MSNKFSWDLSNLFKDEEEFYEKIKEVEFELKEITETKDNWQDIESLFELLDLKWAIKEKANNLLIYGSLHYYKDINCEKAKAMKSRTEKLMNDVDGQLAFIEKSILEVGFSKVKKIMENNDKFLKYQFYIDNIFRKQKHIQTKTSNEKIVDYKNEINESLIKYNNLIHGMDLGTIIVAEEKIELKLSNIDKYLRSHNREVRKETYFAVNKAYLKMESELSNILNNIYKLRLKICKLEKYDSMIEKVLFEENIDSQVITNLIKSVNNNLPLMQKYLSVKGKALGYSEPHLYDYSVPFDNNLKWEYSLEDGIKIIKKALQCLGDKYINIIDELLENGYVDALLDEKKHQTITFSWGCYSFLNYKDSYSDLRRLIHEFGHITNAYLSKKDQPYIYEDSTVFVGEVASLVNEILLNKYLFETATNDDEKLYYLSVGIENFITQVFKQTMDTEFENDLYYNSNQGVELDVSLLNEKYFSLKKKYYGKEPIYDECSKIEWTRLGHLYRWSYYVYQYATGYIMASYIVNSLVYEKTITTEQYLKFLASGSSDYALNLLKEIGIDLTDEEIINKGFKGLESELENLSQILSKKR